jgi:Flp pilus assembly protein TadD
MFIRFLFLTLFFFVLMLSNEQLLGQSIHPGLSAEEREQYIQKALEFRKLGNVYQAIEQVDLILSAGPNDEGALMLKGDLMAQSKQYDLASTIYQQLLDLDDQKIQAQINLSYALFMNNKPELALKQAKSAWEECSGKLFQCYAVEH